MKKLLIFTFSLTLLCMSAASCGNMTSGQQESVPTDESTSLQTSLSDPVSGTQDTRSEQNNIEPATENTADQNTNSFG